MPKTTAQHTFPNRTRLCGDTQARVIPDRNQNLQAIQFGILKCPVCQQTRCRRCDSPSSKGSPHPVSKVRQSISLLNSTQTADTRKLTLS